jgi:hypothetical protein
MAWYPGAVKMELQPESDAQPAIQPTQFIMHSIVAPWTVRRTYEFWRDSTNLESHFAVDYEGAVAQFIGTETRADANAGANRRADGTGAVSVETASNTSASDPWNAKQIEDLIAIGVWLHEEHEIPLRICRSHTDPGYGYHSMFPQWSTSGTACPGNARIEQFTKVVFPGIVARATGQSEEDDMPTVPEIVKGIAKTDGIFDVPLRWRAANPTNEQWQFESILAFIGDRALDAGEAVKKLDAKVSAQQSAGLTDAQVQAIADKVAASPRLADTIASKVADLLAARLAE